MEVKYTPEGPKGKTCNVCKNFNPTKDEKGMCFEHEVVATGNCNFFKPK